jgi:glycosyltransferase involved in cell wall biosynthesis
MLLLITHSDQYTDSSDCSGQTVLLDAMSSALPIVATRKIYLDDYVREREEILKVNFYDVDDVIDKIKMLNDSILADHLAKAARNRVVENFTSRKMAENLSKIFKQLL